MLAAAAGPPLGGALVELGDWRAIFLVNLPWVGLTLLLALHTVPAGLGGQRRGRFDGVGVAVLTGLLAGWAWLLNPGDVPAWVVPAGFVAVGITLVVFLRYELAHPDPVLQPRLLRVRPFAAATAWLSAVLATALPGRLRLVSPSVPEAAQTRPS